MWYSCFLVGGGGQHFSLCFFFFFFFFFFPVLVMSAAHDRGGFGPIFVYNADTADFLLCSNFSIMCPLADSNYNSLDGIRASYPPPASPHVCCATVTWIKTLVIFNMTTMFIPPSGAN